MPKLIDFKVTAAEKKKRAKEIKDGPTPQDYEDSYPYNLRISLDKELLKKVPAAKKLKGGQMVDIVARAKVTEVRITDTDGSQEPERIEIQIQKMGIAPPNMRDEEKAAGFSAATSKS